MPNASGFIGGSSKTQYQVTFHGKIVTPQSLISRKSQSHGHDGGTKPKKAFVGSSETIDENAPDLSDKPSAHSLLKLKRCSLFNSLFYVQINY